MSQVLDEVLSANAAYAASFVEKEALAIHPAYRFAILTCMDARLDPAKFAGLAEDDAHVIRNANWHNVGSGPGSEAGDFVIWLTIDQPHDAVITDVRRIRSHPLAPPAVPIYGYLFDVRTDSLVGGPEATRIGAATSPRK